MSKARPFSWVPFGVVAVLVLSLVVAWAFRDRLFRTVECATLYAEAMTAGDSADVDTVVVVPAGARPAVTCADVRAGR